jgi:hypothetical protein
MAWCSEHGCPDILCSHVHEWRENMAKAPKVLLSEVRDGCYVKCWKERREYVVQVWLKATPEGAPDGDWSMPGVLGITASVAQAIIQTREDAKKVVVDPPPPRRPK